jgi:hypothetical protein
MDSVELLLKACEKAIELLNLRNKRNAQYLAEVVEPIHAKLEAVVRDYYSFFSQCEEAFNQLGEEGVIVDAVVGRIRSARDEIVLSRKQVVAFVNCLAPPAGERRPSHESRAEIAYAVAVEDIFFPERVTADIGGESYATVAVNLFEVAVNGMPSGDLRNYIRLAKNNIESGWERACAAHARMRLQALGFRAR